MVCRALPPFGVVYANPDWEALCGFSSAEMLGRDLRVLQGPDGKFKLEGMCKEGDLSAHPIPKGTYVGCTLVGREG